MDSYVNLKAVSSRTAPYGQLLGLTVRHSHQGALWLVEIVVRSGVTHLRVVRRSERGEEHPAVLSSEEWW